MSNSRHHPHHNEIHHHDQSDVHKNKTRIFVTLAAVTMVVEIYFDYFTNSMALLSDGYHMSSHVFALGLPWLAYFFARKYSETKIISFRKENHLSLSGLTSAIVLQVVAVVLVIQSFERLIHPFI